MSDLIEKLEAWAWRNPFGERTQDEAEGAAEMLYLLKHVIEAADACKGNWTTPELRLVDEALADLREQLETE